MRNDRRREREARKAKKKDERMNGFCRILSIIYSILVLAFIGLIVWLNVLPMKYLIAIIVILLLISVFIVPVMYSKHGVPGRKKIATGFAVVLIALFGVGTYYLAATLDFLGDITSLGGSKETFYLLVDKESEYKKAEELSGETIGAYAAPDKNYAQARAMLVDELDVEYKYEEELSLLFENLDKDYKAIFISAASYESVNGDDGTLEDDVKILHKITVKVDKEQTTKGVDVTKEPFNVLISGIDIEGDIDIISRSDVNMVATINPVTKEVLLTSIPRDAYVVLPSKESYDKLTHTGLYGATETVQAVEDLMGIDINYYVKVNYSTVVKLVDAIGGIDIYSPYSFTTHGMDEVFTFNQGNIHLNGEQALAYSRERKSWLDGDMRRNENQQLILEAIIKKAVNSSTILSRYTSILNSIKDNMETDMDSNDMTSLIKMQINDMASWKIERQAIKGEPDYQYCYAVGANASVVRVYTTDIAAEVDKILEVQKVPTDEGNDD